MFADGLKGERLGFLKGRLGERCCCAGLLVWGSDGGTVEAPE